MTQRDPHIHLLNKTLGNVMHVPVVVEVGVQVHDRAVEGLVVQQQAYHSCSSCAPHRSNHRPYQEQGRQQRGVAIANVDVVASAGAVSVAGVKASVIDPDVAPEGRAEPVSQSHVVEDDERAQRLLTGCVSCIDIARGFRATARKSSL
jgi:hypothetical protein